MEALEFAVSEIVPEPVTVDRIPDSAADYIEFEDRMPLHFSRVPKLSWLLADEICGAGQKLVATDLTVLGVPSRELPGISRSSGGTASGNTLDEALFHGLCELIERDAVTLHSLSKNQPRQLVKSQLGGFVGSALHKMAKVDITANIFDLTSPIGVPVVKAVIRDGRGMEGLHFGVSAGFACHLDRELAVAGALLEACQTRISNISGARDDFDPEEYLWNEIQDRRPLATSVSQVLQTVENLPKTYPDAVRMLVSKIHAAGLERPYYYLYPTLIPDLIVIKAFCSGLEDRVGNRHWRPGIRSLGMLWS